jgi:hypothetical protein
MGVPQLRLPLRRKGRGVNRAGCRGTGYRHRPGKPCVSRASEFRQALLGGRSAARLVPLGERKQQRVQRLSLLGVERSEELFLEPVGKRA